MPSRDEMLRSELTGETERDLQTLRALLHIPENRDAVERRHRCADFGFTLFYMEGMAGDAKISEFILHASKSPAASGIADPVGWLKEESLEVAQCERESRVKELLTGILGGMTCVLADGCAEALLLDTRGFEHRRVDRPSNEAVVLGAQEGFVESLRDNLTLLHRYVQSGELITERLTVGTGVPTSVALVYLNGVADVRAVDEARRRLQAITAASVPGIGGIQQLIEDSPRAIFPQMLQTERPDRAASCLIDGQFVILADNSPYALAAPITLFHLLHASDDMFMRWQYATLLRLIRFAGVLLALLLPGLYVALTLHHTHLVPLTLLLSIAETRADVPFTILMEVLIMEFSFYLINEAGTRIPSQIGSTVSIVGALVLGQAAVSASIISPILVILVAITGLGNYAAPNYGFGLSIVLYRVLFVLAGAALGLYGVLLMLVALSVRLCGIHSFGVPYLAPVAPKRPHGPDILLRLSLRRQQHPMYYAQRGSWMKGKRSK